LDVLRDRGVGDLRAAEAPSLVVLSLGRHRHRFVHPALSGMEVAWLAPQLVVGLGARRRELVPRLLEAGPRFLEGLAGSVGLSAGIAPWVKSAVPSPLRSVRRDSSAPADMTDADVAEVDEPALSVRVFAGSTGGLRLACGSPGFPAGLPFESFLKQLLPWGFDDVGDILNMHVAVR
jgi:hypothetical protein